jgi:adenosine deaminase
MVERTSAASECRFDPPSDLAALPKAEVHVHLEGTIRPATLDAMARREGLQVPRAFTDLRSFIDVISGAWAAMAQPGDYARLVREYCEDAVRAGVRYAELELVPIGRAHDVLGEAVAAAARETDVVVRFVAGVTRNLPIELAWMTLDAVRDHPAVVAIGLGGDESGYPAELFAELFAEARRRGLPAAPHAGEDAGPASVRAALDALGAARIQHGVRAIESPDLVAELVARGIPLAVCPTSNVRLGVAASLDAHPLRALAAAGVRLSINTDDPGFFDCDLLGEYAIAGRLLALDRDGYARLAARSVESSFAPAPLKRELGAAIAAWRDRG